MASIIALGEALTPPQHTHTTTTTQQHILKLNMPGTRGGKWGWGGGGTINSRSILSQRKTKQKLLNSIPWLKTREGASTLNRVAVLERKQLGEREGGLFSSAASRTEGEVFLSRHLHPEVGQQPVFSLAGKLQLKIHDFRILGQGKSQS